MILQGQFVLLLTHNTIDVKTCQERNCAMADMDIKTYQEYVKNSRAGFFETPYDLVYRVFEEQGFINQDHVFFKNNASLVVETLRRGCWDAYVPVEKAFISQMLCSLIEEEQVADLSPREAVVWFAETHPEHIYQLSLSNTQSRRSRAGKEFEAIIEMVLIGAGIPMDTQGNIGKKMFVEKGLGKLVDTVSPGVVEYMIDKNDVVLISAKTTLRERWQEVPEEMGRTGAREMYLATLDENISDEVLETLYESNIRITTTKNIKEQHYPNNRRVLDFERLVEICDQNYSQWETYEYSEEESEQIIQNINTQIIKHENHAFVLQHYMNRLQEFLKQ